MIDDSGPNSIFGVSRGLDRVEIDELEAFLRSAWIAQFGEPPSSPSSDFEKLAKTFRKDIQGRSLRDAAVKLEAISSKRPLLSDEIFIAVDDRRGFVTPEGRALLDELQWIRENDTNFVSRDRLLRALSMVADFYGESTRRWMKKELSGGDLRPSTYGFVVLLLLNGSVGEENAIALPSSAGQEAQLVAVVIPVINAFSESIGGSALAVRESARLRSNWAVTEASRQLPGMVRRSEGPNSVLRFWVVPEREAELINKLGQSLARRKGVTTHIVANAMDAARAAYTDSRPALVSWGMCHEHPKHSQRVASSLTDAFVHSLALD